VNNTDLPGNVGYSLDLYIVLPFTQKMPHHILLTTLFLSSLPAAGLESQVE
jgi:hypothetical protein